MLNKIPKINDMPVIIPARVILQKTVTGDYPVGHETVAVSGEYPAYCNKYGALSVKTEKGKLGLKPSEFDVIKFTLNPYIGTEITKRKIGEFRKNYKALLGNWKAKAIHRGVLIDERIVNTVLNELEEWLDKEGK